MLSDGHIVLFNHGGATEVLHGGDCAVELSGDPCLVAHQVDWVFSNAAAAFRDISGRQATRKHYLAHLGMEVQQEMAMPWWHLPNIWTSPLAWYSPCQLHNFRPGLEAVYWAR
jgi:hypothetical protein